MLSDYIHAALARASYEKLDDGTYYGEIPQIQGVWANEPELEACRAELQSALEDWLLFSLSNGFPVPALDGIELTAARVG